MSLESKFKLSMSADKLRAKYAEERDRRIRADGASQYQELKGRFADLDEDPYVTEKIVRDPIVTLCPALASLRAIAFPRCPVPPMTAISTMYSFLPAFVCCHMR